eukprot:363737-Chlamydomonas_euryale.AAC.7
MGGECNYLLRVTPDDKRLEFVPEDLWQTDVMRRWDERDIDDMLASAQASAREMGWRLAGFCRRGGGMRERRAFCSRARRRVRATGLAAGSIFPGRRGGLLLFMVRRRLQLS